MRIVFDVIDFSIVQTRTRSDGKSPLGLGAAVGVDGGAVALLGDVPQADSTLSEHLRDGPLALDPSSIRRVAASCGARSCRRSPSRRRRNPAAARSRRRSRTLASAVRTRPRRGVRRRGERCVVEYSCSAVRRVKGVFSTPNVKGEHDCDVVEMKPRRARARSGGDKHSAISGRRAAPIVRPSAQAMISATESPSSTEASVPFRGPTRAASAATRQCTPSTAARARAASSRRRPSSRSPPSEFQ